MWLYVRTYLLIVPQWHIVALHFWSWWNVWNCVSRWITTTSGNVMLFDRVEGMTWHSKLNIGIVWQYILYTGPTKLVLASPLALEFFCQHDSGQIYPREYLISLLKLKLGEVLIWPFDICLPQNGHENWIRLRFQVKKGKLSSSWSIWYNMCYPCYPPLEYVHIMCT